MQLPADDPGFDALLEGSVPHCRVGIAPDNCGTLLTGLAMLAREGRIRLEVAMRPMDPPLGEGPWHLRDKKRLQTTIEVEGGGSCAIDVHDGWEIDEEDLAGHDLYFKRGLSPETLLLPEGRKLRTLGLLSGVRPDFFDMIELRSELASAATAPARLRKLLRWGLLSLGSRVDLGSRPTLSRMSSPPIPGQPAGVMLMTGLWDPAPVPGWATGKREEWESINQMRIECVRALRREFGARFHGGIRPCEYARRRAPDVLLPSARAASQREFVRRTLENPVCVTSVGLHGSNGWRLAEFVALSRAIVSETLRYSVPGPFAAGSHYLPFGSPDECVAQVTRLFEDGVARDAMASRNWEYHRAWQRPDRVAMRVIALTRAVGRGNAG